MIDPLREVRQPGGVMRWQGASFRFKDGSSGTVRGLPVMCYNQRVNLTLATPAGVLYLTTSELLANIQTSGGVEL